LAVTVTEHVIRDPVADDGMVQEAEELIEVRASEVCVTPLMSKL
jgi:hypothetical protein